MKGSQGFFSSQIGQNEGGKGTLYEQHLDHGLVFLDSCDSDLRHTPKNPALLQGTALENVAMQSPRLES